MDGGPNSAKANQETEVTPKGTENAQNKQVTLAQENEEQVDTPPSNKEKGEAIQTEAIQGSPSNPSYAEIARKKPIESFGSSEDETYERQTKKKQEGNPAKKRGRRRQKDSKHKEVKLQ